jgi:hypothetical protein
MQADCPSATIRDMRLFAFTEQIDETAERTVLCPYY